MVPPAPACPAQGAAPAHDAEAHPCEGLLWPIAWGSALLPRCSPGRSKSSPSPADISRWRAMPVLPPLSHRVCLITKTELVCSASPARAPSLPFRVFSFLLFTKCKQMQKSFPTICTIAHLTRSVSIQTLSQKQTVGQFAQGDNNAERFALRIQNPSQSSGSCPGKALYQSFKLLTLASGYPGSQPNVSTGMPRNTKAQRSLRVKCFICKLQMPETAESVPDGSMAAAAAPRAGAAGMHVCLAQSGLLRPYFSSVL